MHITLRPNEKIYINGAVLRVDRKVSLELMNDAVFLLEAHVMMEKQATTPLRKLYFIVQLMLIEPQDLAPKRMMFDLQGLQAATRYAASAPVQDGLAAVTELVGRSRPFEALKVLRNLFPIEDAILGEAGDREAAPCAPADPVPAPAGPLPPASSIHVMPPAARPRLPTVVRANGSRAVQRTLLSAR